MEEDGNLDSHRTALLHFLRCSLCIVILISGKSGDGFEADVVGELVQWRLGAAASKSLSHVDERMSDFDASQSSFLVKLRK